jgi:hypothetical protein
VNLNIHFHTLALDGAFSETPEGALAFTPAPPPSDEEVARLLATIRRRVRRLLVRRGLLVEETDLPPPDLCVDESSALASMTAASVQGRVALGRRAGARVLTIGRDPDAPWVMSTGPRQAHLDGFDLHANVDVSADDRLRLEQLCRYVLRPPIAQDRLAITAEARILLTLKSEWSDGTTHLLFEPLELLEKLAALTPRPRINLLLYHGVLAPNARWRARAVAYGTSAIGAGSGPATTAAAAVPPTTDRVPVHRHDHPTPQIGAAPSSATPRSRAWADLMRRVFDLDTP